MNLLKFAGLFFVFAVALSHNAEAQKLDKYYTRHTQEGGDLFFLYANEDFRCEQNHTDFLFDVTFREGNDSVTINYTYYRDEAEPAQKLIINSGEESIEADASKLFIDFEKKMWLHRYSSKIPFDVFAGVVNSGAPPVFEVKTEKGLLSFSGNARKWDKYTEAVSKILYIIDSE